MRLNAKMNARWDEDPFVVRLTSDFLRPKPLRVLEALLVSGEGGEDIPHDFKACISRQGKQGGLSGGMSLIPLPSDLSYVKDGDILAVQPRSGELRVLYRKSAPQNALMVTPSCNNFCLMCSQPPQKADSDIYRLAWDAIPLMDIDTPGITLSGGEPTLVGRHLVDLIKRLKSYLPATAVHVLSNGRQLKYLAFAQDLAEVEHPDLVIGIPLYSDVSHEHDFIVQARGAFDETTRGILNAARCGLRIELRVVITKTTSAWLPRIARFISRNFPFACNVTFMGLEPVGFAKANLAKVWIDPIDYSDSLGEAVQELKWHRIPVTVYNHQLCTISHQLWTESRQSISDWKNIFLPECQECSVRHRCCGFFASGREVHSRAIKPIAPSD